jgi:hypothetical protein
MTGLDVKATASMWQGYTQDHFRRYVDIGCSWHWLPWFYSLRIGVKHALRNDFPFDHSFTSCT